MAFGKKLIDEGGSTICLGRDPCLHGERLADAFARGAESVDGVKVLYTGLASTPEMLVFCAPNWEVTLTNNSEHYLALDTCSIVTCFVVSTLK